MLQIPLYKIHTIRKSEFMNCSDTSPCLCKYFLRYQQIMISIFVLNLFFFLISISCFIRSKCNCWEHHGHNQREGFSVTVSFNIVLCIYTRYIKFKYNIKYKYDIKYSDHTQYVWRFIMTGCL